MTNRQVVAGIILLSAITVLLVVWTFSVWETSPVVAILTGGAALWTTFLVDSLRRQLRKWSAYERVLR